MSDNFYRPELLPPYGTNGGCYVWIVMVENEQRIRQVARDIKRYLKSIGVNVPSGNEVLHVPLSRSVRLPHEGHSSFARPRMTRRSRSSSCSLSSPDR